MRPMFHLVARRRHEHGRRPDGQLYHGALSRWLLSAAITQISFLPLLIPGIAFGAAYIAFLGAPIGVFPALYGSFALLVIDGST